jgi:hypothetical protein
MEDRPLVVYLSVAAAIGNVCQPVYEGVNCFLDEIMSMCRSCGMCGRSIQRPAISGLGMDAADPS